MSADVRFLDDLMTHYRAFAQAAGVGADNVHVQFTFADGSTLEAVAIRESHVVKATFALDRKTSTRIGIHTEISSV